jgi:hypothetical protein
MVHIISQIRTPKFFTGELTGKIGAWFRRVPRTAGIPICHDVKTIDLTALILLAEDDPAGTYLLEESDGLLLLWRISNGEPDDAALLAASLWPLLLPPER